MTGRVASQGVRERLRSLLLGDLAFRDGDRGHPLHTLHAFAARFPAPLPRHFIQGLSEPGDVVLDPMAGSGATLLEGWLLSRRVVGVDLDPLAVRLCAAKTTRLEPTVVATAGHRVVAAASLLVRLGDPLTHLRGRLDEATRAFLDYWFRPDTQRELAALVLAIEQEPDARVKTLLEALFSSVIVTKSGGVSLARDLAHSRPHRVEDKPPASAIKKFEDLLCRAVHAFGALPDASLGWSTVVRGDCRSLPLADGSVDLIVTSPPYANALDYVRAHKFSLAWLGEPIQRLGTLRGRYIGAERWDGVEGAVLPEAVEATIVGVSEVDAGRARVLDKYFRDMALALREMYRVLRRGRAAAVVIGPSTMRGIRVATHEHLAAIAEGTGFEVAGVVKRTLDRDRRMMPARWQGNGQSTIEQRIHEEFVIGLVKP